MVITNVKTIANSIIYLNLIQLVNIFSMNVYQARTSPATRVFAIFVE